jgi:uncharacterized protein
MENEAPEPIEVPHTELSTELLQAVIESFVLREGTDYGEREFSLEDKVAKVIAQLKRGEETDSVTIVAPHATPHR